MTDLLLAKPQLSSDWIDLSVGEGSIIRNNLFRHFPSLHDPTTLALDHNIALSDFEYLPPAGLKALVDFLEEQHQAPVIIGNGAKQLLGAAFYALTKQGIWDVYLQPIHWALIPPLAKVHNVEVRYAEPNKWARFSSDEFRSAYLLVAPNNPDGACPDYATLKEWEQKFGEQRLPLIFDGAYYTHSYLGREQRIGNVGDVQIFSFSKMLGLSSVRGGYAVCHNKKFYTDMVGYLEMMTVGVSMLTQKYLLAILEKMKTNPLTTTAFEKANFEGLREAKKLLKEIPANILEVPENIEETVGMFAWLTVKDVDAFRRAKIYVVGGEIFGDANKVRLNLGMEMETLKECVKRLKEAA